MSNKARDWESDWEIAKKSGRDVEFVSFMYYPGKMTCEEFIKELFGEKEDFIENMRQLGMEDKYMEEWLQVYAGWKEIPWVK